MGRKSNQSILYTLHVESDFLLFTIKLINDRHWCFIVITLTRMIESKRPD